jgi:hypothetical protein
MRKECDAFRLGHSDRNSPMSTIKEIGYADAFYD